MIFTSLNELLITEIFTEMNIIKISTKSLIWKQTIQSGFLLKNWSFFYHETQLLCTSSQSIRAFIFNDNLNCYERLTNQLKLRK